MNSVFTIRRAVAALLLCAVAGSVAAQGPHEAATNLKVLPKDVSHEDLIKVMNGFTRALGVRCIYCHVGEEGKPFRPEDFALDDKPTKKKARVMMRMVQDLNDKYLATLDSRADPPLSVQCVTCHRGAAQPRMLQDVLKTAYDQGGMDSTLARYQSLHDRFYGRFVYDFGEVPLVDLANQVRDAGHAGDAERLLEMNVETHPKSAFAKRQHAASAIAAAFGQAGVDSGMAAYRSLKDQYGSTVVSEEVMNGIGYRLLGTDQVEPALAVFKLIVADNPTSANGYDSLGEAYEKHGDRKLAIESYAKSLELNPANDHAKQKLDELRAGSKAGGKKGKKTG
jgi:Flp pilus assembly protein TadD